LFHFCLLNQCVVILTPPPAASAPFAHKQSLTRQRFSIQSGELGELVNVVDRTVPDTDWRASHQACELDAAARKLLTRPWNPGIVVLHKKRFNRQHPSS